MNYFQLFRTLVWLGTTIILGILALAGIMNPSAIDFKVAMEFLVIAYMLSAGITGISWLMDQ